MAVSAAWLLGCRAEPEPDTVTRSAPAQSDVMRRGELLSYACQACHTLGPDGRHQVGPNLHGVFGRAAGAAAGFDYSAALAGSGIIWSPDELDQWLADPAGFLPGTTMAFTGYQAAADRGALIMFLLAATAEPAAGP